MHFLTILGIIFIAVGTLLTYYGQEKNNKKSAADLQSTIKYKNNEIVNLIQEKDKKEDELRQEKEDKEQLEKFIANIPKVYLHSLRIFFVEFDKNIYRLGIIARILNRDNTLAHVVNGLFYSGKITLGSSSISYRIGNPLIDPKTGEILGIKPFISPNTKVEDTYYLKPGEETNVKFIMDNELHLDFMGTDPNTIEGAYPEVMFDGTWSTVIQNIEFSFNPIEMRVEKFITLEEWDSMKKRFK